MIHQIDWSKLDWKTMRPGVEQKAFSGDGATIALHRLQPDHEPKPHKHENEQIAYIVSGTVDFHVGDEVVRMGPGAIIRVPPNTMHHAVVVGEEEVINIDVFTPARPEYAPLPEA
ncbi:cupin domain-containing protein [Celeribacter indicus]|uniref:Cupin 2 barrel domain-containing protein n=1 Tax=Celeribacter indicus TaxID=1208324 RepID=A0A0B5E133_9RHOB|nr:cupin domain-containing protein [Celeribacter indicus]AJE46706.1 cupin 2 barrel domain-containing protein [Celeribacter indicus]SDX04434.1 Mannose-6-phosphate isomerase, cupin superfamily [Celeribacter indicus]